MRFWLAALCLLGGLNVAGPAAAQSPVWALHGAHNTVYLAESIHLLRPDAATLPPAFDRAWNDSSVLVMELDLGHLDQSQLSGWMLQHGRYANGGTLERAMGPERYAEVGAAAAKLGQPPQTLDRLKPWVAALVLTDLSYMKQGFDPDSGVERQLLARRDHVHQTAGLETLDQELGQLDRLSAADQAKFLEQTVTDLEDGDQQTDDMVRAWRRGDTVTLAKLLSEDYTEFPTLYDALVTERNQRWLPQIQQFLAGGRNYLVVVGALHVVGRGGLLELVRKAGIKVEPVN